MSNVAISAWMQAVCPIGPGEEGERQCALRRQHAAADSSDSSSLAAVQITFDYVKEQVCPIQCLIL
jgi:hypothetical protein